MVLLGKRHDQTAMALMRLAAADGLNRFVSFRIISRLAAGNGSCLPVSIHRTYPDMYLLLVLFSRPLSSIQRSHSSWQRAATNSPHQASTRHQDTGATAAVAGNH